MDINALSLRRDEEAVLALRSLYEKHGYTKYRMSKFEEYDFYVENKSFLQGSSILTFTDLSGKLMALKPDITLSIVKNARSGRTEKVYYNENVYRASDGGHEFREIMQVGLECIGAQDAYTTAEVIRLAEQSLELLSEKSLLDLSHMGLIMGLLEETGLPHSARARISDCVGGKNAHELRKICRENGVSPALTEKLAKLTTLYGPFAGAISGAWELDTNEITHAALCELEEVFDLVCAMSGGGRINLDFSIASDMNYYNGIIFQGFVRGVPTGVLSGGRYDNLLPRFGLGGGAIGFAVYLGMLERYLSGESGYDAEVLLVYGEEDDPAAVARCARRLRTEYGSVRVHPGDGAEAPRCRIRLRFGKETEQA